VAKVFFIPVGSYKETETISRAGRRCLEAVMDETGITLEANIPLKVHFGEEGNVTYIHPDNYQGMIDVLRERKVETCFIDTNVLYSGHRMIREQHIETARRHGFTQVPVEIADGHHGDEYEEVRINGKHFSTCKVGSRYREYPQLIVVAHFKGHILAGFGGAIKQLSMGCAARGGKLAMHANARPFINPLTCKKCMTCVKHCPVDAITIKTIPSIDKDKCVGCAACIAVCPHKAININWLHVSRPSVFHEKLAEYALAAQTGKTCMYVNFVLNITRGCDCEGRRMKPFVADLGVLASSDPVSVDAACIHLLEKREGKKLFRGKRTLEIAEGLGLGSRSFDLVTLGT
jgi:uncharacterized protein